VVLIKKYDNRRLYDTEESRYITLDELAEKIRKGADVRVEGQKTSEDLTQATLTQIILESRGAARLLPVSLLTQLIRMGDDALAEFFGRYLGSSLELYLQAKQGANALAPWNPFANLPFAATSALARLLVGGAPDRSEIDELRREIEDLKRAIRGGDGAEGARRRRK
jgi:polyhydroxyalkanoate synthesis repressor PhaR